MARFRNAIISFLLLALLPHVCSGASRNAKRGIGIIVSSEKNPDYLTVTYVAPYSKAVAAGIQKGDHIVAIDGVTIAGMPSAEANHLIWKDTGGSIKLGINRAGAPVQEISVVRESFIDCFLPAAANGDLRAELLLASYYEIRFSLDFDPAKSLEWYLKAANQGDASAQVNVGYIYDEGIGVPKNPVAAAAWYLKAAKQGNVMAEMYLARLYRLGQGVPQSYQDAFAWYCSAALYGDVEAERWLGQMYHEGLGVKKDLAASTSWYLLAAKHGDAVAERCTGLGYLWGEGVPKQDSYAFAWLYAAAHQDDRKAQNFLGTMFRDGKAVSKNDAAAFAWYYRSAQLGYHYGEWNLAFMYEMGRGVRPDIGEALKYYKRAYAGLPEEEKLKGRLLNVSLKAFLQSPETCPLEPSLLMSMYKGPISAAFAIFLAVYAAGSIFLVYASFKSKEDTPGLRFAIGWIVFYEEAQVAAALASLVMTVTLTAGNLFAFTALFCTVPVLLSTCGPNKRRIWKPSGLTWAAQVLHGIAGYAVILCVMVVYEKIYTHFSHAPLPKQETSNLIASANHESAALAWFAIAIALPVVEEILFRSYLMDALRRRFSSPGAILISATAFALIHFQSLYFPPLFTLGLVLGWLKVKSNSIRLPIVLHCINNTLFLVMS